jgi:hypothetical protein
VNSLTTYPEGTLRYNNNYFFDTASGEISTSHAWQIWNDVDDNLVVRVDDVIERKLY